MQESMQQQEEDLNLVEIWLRRDPIRWIAGILAGLFAGVVMLVFAMLLSKVGGAEFWLPVKIAALPILGAKATETGFNVGSLAVGFIFAEVLCASLGLAYAHFTGAGASMQALLGASFTWGAFSWVFIICLFLQSVYAVQYMEIPRGPAFFVMMVFGLALASVTFFDRMLRGK